MHVDRIDGIRNGSDILEPLAIIGFSLKFPQDADCAAGFWRMLGMKKCAMTSWPKDRVNLDAFHDWDDDGTEKPSVAGANFLKEDIGCFDAAFFGISAIEATAMDPQHRLLLETTYRALENAGIPMEHAYGTKTAVYSGCMTDDYKLILTKDMETMPKYTGTGVSPSMIANRLSWFFNFKGPSVNLDSACSSSLMALDMACQSLRTRSSNMALVAGSSLITAAEGVHTLNNMSFLSPDGRCFSFDERANGYSRGEGVAVVVVKRLTDAIKDNNTIRAIIRSTGSNQDGHTAGVTQPDQDSQALLIRETYEKAGLDLSSTRFFEAHGTGTALGDPTETAAIGSVFRNCCSQDNPLYIGSVKANIGHLEGGSGLAGVIKAVIMLEKAIIPPNANFERLNPKINAEYLHIKVPTEVTPWPSQGLRRVSINSFGFGGSNAHAVLDDAFNFLAMRGLYAIHCTAISPPQNLVAGMMQQPKLDAESRPSTPTNKGYLNGLKRLPNGLHKYRNEQNGVVDVSALSFDHENELQPSREHALLVWSAADEKGIARLMESYEAYFHDQKCESTDQESYLRQLAHVLATNRSSLPWKSFALADSTASLGSLKNLISPPVRSGNAQGVGFVFTGQGAQYYRMGAALFAYPVFRDAIRACDEALREFGCEWSTLQKLGQGDSEFDIHDPEHSQPLTTVLQIGLVDLLESFNISPVAVVGHSSGEIAAAYAKGGLSLHSACKVSYYRGKLASRLKKASGSSSMISVDLPESEIAPYIRRINSQHGYTSICVACINSPKNVTVSGDDSSIEMLKFELDSRRVPAQKLKTGVAYHSPHMEHIALEYAMALGGLQKRDKKLSLVTMISSVTTEVVSSVDVLCTADYWVRNMVQPVRFREALSLMILHSIPQQPECTHSSKLAPMSDLLEVGPHPALRRPVAAILEGLTTKSDIRYSSVLSRNELTIKPILKLTGNLWSRGYPIALNKVNRAELAVRSKDAAFLDLPEYPFDHTRRYWYDSKISKDTRLPRHHRLELLGMPMPDWNPSEARWRRFIDPSETPWVEDHKISGTTLYPATGMIVMAIEGAKQLAEPNRPVVGYLVKDTVFFHPITITTGEKTELQLCIRPIRSRSEKDFPSSEFRIYIRTRDEWQENCRGTIQVQYAATNPEWTAENEHRKARHFKERYDSAVQSCQVRVDRNKFYSHLDSLGLFYGRDFQALDNLAWDGRDTAVGDVEIFKWTPQQSHHRIQPHVVHPVTFDAVGQLMWVALTKGGNDTTINDAAVTRIRSAWCSSSGLASVGATTESAKLKTFVNTSFKGFRGTDSSLFALDQSGNLKLWIDNLETTSVSGINVAHSQSEARRLCYSMSWKPDLNLLSSDEIVAYCRGDQNEDYEIVESCPSLERVLISFARRAMSNSLTTESANRLPHLKKYVALLQRQIDGYLIQEEQMNEVSLPCYKKFPGSLDAIAEGLYRGSARGKLMITVARRLREIIEGTLDLESVISGENLAENFYRELVDRSPCCEQVQKYIEALAHKNPHMKILEIGAGQGLMTEHILAGLTDQSQAGVARFSRYDITDKVAASLEKARDSLSVPGPNMGFKVLDIEHDPQSQGYGAESYDLVVVALALHATPDLRMTLRHVRSILKPGGKLILLEIVKSDILQHELAFGALPSWWNTTEKKRSKSPYVSEAIWSELFASTGFSGLDFPLPDSQDEGQKELSVLVTTALEPRIERTRASKTTLLINPRSNVQLAIAEDIRKGLEGPESFTCDIVSVHEAKSTKYASLGPVVSLLEIESPYLSSLDEVNFKAIQELMSKTKSLIWVNAASRTSASFPHFRMANGLGRVLCTENSNFSFTTLSLDGNRRDLQSWARSICKVIMASRSENARRELEYEEQNGRLLINRVADTTELNSEIQIKSSATSSLREFSQHVPLVLNIATPGLIDSLQFVEDERYGEALKADEVEIEVKAIGVNFRDLLVVLGRLNASTVGCECSGIVTRVGSNCVTLKPGDSVCAAIIGCTQTYARCHYQQAIKFPDNFTFAQAASIPITGVTAYHALVNTARLTSDDSILIHSGAGGTGQMAIQIAQSIGAEVFATVSSEEKRDFLKGFLPDDHIFYSRNLSFKDDVMRMTKGRGVDVVLNSLSGEALLASWECIAPFGRFVELGKADIEANNKLPMEQFMKNVSFSLVAIDHMATERPRMIQSSLKSVLKMLAEGAIKLASPMKEFSVSEMEAAFRWMQSGKSIGKMIINLNPTDLVPTVLRHKPTYSFDPNATYVIAGGLGGLGRSAARWMTSRGVRNLILLSRSGPKSDAAAALLKELTAIGARVETPKCDVSSTQSLSSALAQCSAMPAIKGCIQGTMVLQDAIFEKMTHSEWSTSIRAKVDSTWNLHQLLPNDLDFFIMLSSVAGIIGSAGQSNYAAGNTYQDAFAQYRRTQGQRAISIDLGWMADVGVIAENERYTKGREAIADMAPIYETEFHALLEHFCDPTLDEGNDSSRNTQTIIGLVPPSQFLSRGLDVPDFLDRPLFSTLAQSDDGAVENSGRVAGNVDHTARFVRAPDEAEAKAALLAGLLEKLAKALDLRVEEIDAERPLHAYGVDSLLAVELRNWFAKVFKADVAVFDITGQGSIRELAGVVAGKSGLRGKQEGVE